jgi:radical SAM protein with 4Fe4S-binding SPASM domain
MDCGLIPQLGYSDFSRRLHWQAAIRRIPIMGSLELTFRCNLRCQHCYVAHGRGGIPGRRELSTAEINHIIDEVVDEGCLWFLITGGEPLWRRDFADIYSYARSRGLLVTLFTNGTLLTPRSADLLAEQRPFLVEITLYGATQETYDRVTGVPGSYARCRRGIELLLERDIPLQLKTIVMAHNQHELADMRSFAQSLGVGFRYDPLLNAGLDGSDRPLALRLAPEQIVQLDMEDSLRRAGLVRRYAELWKGQLPADRLYTCNAGVSSFHIDPYGQLCLCMLDRAQGYDLRSGSFRDGWRSFLAQANAEKCSPQAACGQCALRPACAQCPGWGRLEHGDPQERVAFLCQITHLRAQALAAADKTIDYELFDRAVPSLNTSYTQ